MPHGVPIPNIRFLALIVSEIWSNKILTCRWYHLVSRQNEIILCALRNVCAKYQISRVNSQSKISCMCGHQSKWHHLMSKLNKIIVYTIRSFCVKFQVSSFNSLWVMVKTRFWHVGGATYGGGATWSLDWNILSPWSKRVFVLNIKSLPLLVSGIWTMQYSYTWYAVFTVFLSAFEFNMANIYLIYCPLISKIEWYKIQAKSKVKQQISQNLIKYVFSSFWCRPS